MRLGLDDVLGNAVKVRLVFRELLLPFPLDCRVEIFTIPPAVVFKAIPLNQALAASHQPEPFAVELKITLFAKMFAWLPRSIVTARDPELRISWMCR